MYKFPTKAQSVTKQLCIDSNLCPTVCILLAFLSNLFFCSQVWIEVKTNAVRRMLLRLMIKLLLWQMGMKRGKEWVILHSSSAGNWHCEFKARLSLKLTVAVIVTIHLYLNCPQQIRRKSGDEKLPSRLILMKYQCWKIALLHSDK